MSYNMDMDNRILHTFASNQLAVLMLPRPQEKEMLLLAAELALRDTLRVIDGGNHFNVLALGRMIRRETSNVKEVLNRIYLSRAFTCYQVETMLHALSINCMPILVLDLLNTFYDQSVSDQQSQHLLAGCIESLKRLSRISPIVVSVSPPPKSGERPFLLNMLLEATASNSIMQWELKSTAQLQPMLWEKTDGPDNSFC